MGCVERDKQSSHVHSKVPSKFSTCTCGLLFHGNRFLLLHGCPLLLGSLCFLGPQIILFLEKEWETVPVVVFLWNILGDPIFGHFGVEVSGETLDTSVAVKTWLGLKQFIRYIQ